jgi:hypothetical protein
MPTKTAATTQPPTTGATDPTTADLAALREQKRLLDAQIKAARANQPTRDKLAAEVQRQEAHPNAALVYVLRGMTRRRITALGNRARRPTAPITPTLSQMATKLAKR